MTQYHFDFAFCIGISASMGRHLDGVREAVLRLLRENLTKMSSKDKQVARQRARVVTFGDLSANPKALQVTDFADVGPDVYESNFDKYLNAVAVGGRLRVRPQSALEALSVAIRSDWTHEGNRQRHIIVMFTDSGAHKLESRMGEIPIAFRDQVPASLDELTDRWDDDKAGRLKKWARRLVVFAPDAYPWNVIGDTWGMTIWLPSMAGADLEEVELQTIQDCWLNDL